MVALMFESNWDAYATVVSEIDPVPEGVTQEEKGNTVSTPEGALMWTSPGADAW
jgi:hypothetical protein